MKSHEEELIEWDKNVKSFLETSKEFQESCNRLSNTIKQITIDLKRQNKLSKPKRIKKVRLNSFGQPCLPKRGVYPTAIKFAARMRNIQNHSWNYQYAMDEEERKNYIPYGQNNNTINPRSVIDGIITGLTLIK